MWRMVVDVARVVAAAGGRSVEVEADVPLDEAVTAVLNLWEKTNVPDKHLGVGVLGFQCDLADGQRYGLPPTPSGPDEDRTPARVRP